MLSLTAGTLYQKRFGASAAIAPAIAAQTTLSLLVMTAVVVVTGSSPAPSTLGGWACVGWLGLGPSCAGFAVFYAVLRRTSTVYVSSLLNLVPGGTALASVPILGEPLTLRVAIGLVIALAGMYVGVYSRAGTSTRHDLSSPNRARSRRRTPAPATSSAGR
jgi:drug/metabolite transporter (DMT)-like permease